MAKQKNPDPISTPNVVPMVDVMLVLLIIFMVITPMLSKGMSVDMVRARNSVSMQGADKDDAIVVAVTREGRTFLGNVQLKPEDLPQKVRDLLANRLDKMCYIKSDARARYERVVEVVDNLRASGVDQIGLLTEKVEEKRGAPAAATVTP